MWRGVGCGVEVGGDAGVFGRAGLAEFFEGVLGDADEGEASVVGGLFEQFYLIGREVGGVEPVGGLLFEFDGLADEFGIFEGIGEFGEVAGGEVGVVVEGFEEGGGEGTEGDEEGEGEVFAEGEVEGGLGEESAEEPGFGGVEAFEWPDVEAGERVDVGIGGGLHGGPVFLRLSAGGAQGLQSLGLVGGRILGGVGGWGGAGGGLAGEFF